MPKDIPIGNVSIGFKVDGFSNVVKGLKQIEKSLKSTTDQFKEWDDMLRESKKSLDVLSNNQIVKWFDKISERIVDIGKQQTVLKSLGGEFGVITYKAKQLWGILGKVFGTSTKARILGLVKGLFSMYSWIGLITAGLALFKSVWNYNIGGIQTLWISFIGRISKKWSEFNVKLRTVLLKLEPLFKAVLVPLFKFLGAFVEGFLDGFLSILNVIGEVVEFFKPFFDILNKIFKISDGIKSTFGGWGKTLGKIAAFVVVLLSIWKIGMMIAGVIKVITALMIANPVGAIIFGIAMALMLIIKYWDKIKAGFKKFGGLLMPFMIAPMLIIKNWDKVKSFFVKLGGILKKVFKGAFDFIVKTFKNIVDVILFPIKPILFLFSKLIGFFKGKSGPSPADVASSGGGSTGSTTNINNQPNITIYTSGMDETNAYRIGESLNKGMTNYENLG